MVAKVRTKYESDAGTIHSILLSPDYATAAGTAPTGAVSSPVKVKVTKTNRQFGIKPRGVTLVRTVGTAPDTFVKRAFLPVLSATAFVGTGFAIGSTINIGTVAWTISGKKNEDY